MVISANISNPAAERRLTRIVYFAFLFSTVLILYALRMVDPPINSELDVIFVYTFCGTAALNAGLSLYIRKTKIIPILEAALPDPVSVRKLRKYYIIVYAISEFVFYCGFVLRFFGASDMVASIFWAVAYALFAINFPRWPADAR